MFTANIKAENQQLIFQQIIYKVIKLFLFISILFVLFSIWKFLNIIHSTENNRRG